MENFAKSILNYFAAYTETRFRFDKKIDYFWTDNELTCDLSVFPDFQRNLLEHIQSGIPFDFDITKGEYTIELEEDKFKKTLIESLNNTYGIEYLKNCTKQELDNYRKQYGDKIILMSNGISSEKIEQSQDTKNLKESQLQKDWQRKSFLEGIRTFTNAYSNEVINLLTKLQEEKLDKLKINLNIKYLPPSSFNPQQIRQQIFNAFQKIAQDSISEEDFFERISKFIQDESFNLILYDLYAILRQFRRYIPTGNLYLFFHEIIKKEVEIENNDHNSHYKKQATSKYPIFLVETNIEEHDEVMNIQSVRDIVIINTPAINSLEFKNIITTPRAARFSDAFSYLNQVQKHIQDIYNFYEPFLFNKNYSSLLKEGYPEICFRIGFQIVQKENRKLLDYSELITHIDAGKGGKFINMITNYVIGNVENTTDEVDRRYKEKYPRKSVNSILSTIPLSLNASQKRILTAIENEKNKVVVVDGPPGTGKSYTITAITYWANQMNKSVVITSHKKAALDVIDQMMTDQFKKLHPESKPSIIRLSQDESSVNRYTTTLATQYISSATQRRNAYEEEEGAIEKDIENYFQEVKRQNDLYWKSAEEYEDYVTILYSFEKIRNEFVSKGIISESDYPVKMQKNEEIDLVSVKLFSQEIDKLQINEISLQEINSIYQYKNKIEEWLTACQNISDLAINDEVLGNIVDFNFEDLESFQKKFQEISKNLKYNSPIFTEKEKLKYISIFKKWQLRNNKEFHQKVKELNHLEYQKIIQNVCIQSSKEKSDLTVGDIDSNIKLLFQISQFQKNKNKIEKFLEITGRSVKENKESFDLLRKLKKLFGNQDIAKAIQSLFVLEKYFSDLLTKIGVNFQDIRTIATLFSETDDFSIKIFEYLYRFIELSKININQLPDKRIIKEYHNSVYKELISKNDERMRNLNNFTSDIERIKISLKYNKRLSLKESQVLLTNISCIIAEPDLISQYFPMEEDLIDLLIIDEASQVSIAESISLILRAKQVVIFGDEYQYGAVAAYNVNSSYSKQYFNEILTSYTHDFKVSISESEKDEILEEVSKEEDPNEQEIQPVYKPEEGKNEWLKTFNIRTSTLTFAKALKNYSTSLNIHFRSFPEIIEYSNEFFYRPNQIPLIVNRIRTKPINEVLRFIPVETKGISGNNINLDEIEAIRDDIEKLTANGFKGTMGIITTFREQRDRMEEILNKTLKNYHNLKKNHRLTVWFVGDVQGEERDIIYYSLVESKTHQSSDLRTIFPVIGGTADKPTSLKMQRLNVGFSRPKDTLVIVHSMPLPEYSNTRLGDALKLYQNLKEKAIDNYIEDESIFGSPTEKRLYNLLIQTKFYRDNRDKIRLIAQFPIGEYIRNEYQKYIPKYRVDFLMIFAKDGKEQSLILEYDGVEYHTENPEIVTKHNFSQQYLEYDLQRQLELESYGYHFLRINKFTLLPENKSETEVDVLNHLITDKFILKE